MSVKSKGGNSLLFVYLISNSSRLIYHRTIQSYFHTEGLQNVNYISV